MAEPQPKDLHEGASADPVQSDTLPRGAVDQKAAAALDSLDSRGGDDEAGQGADAEGLKNAMKNLNVKDKPAAVPAVAKKVKIEAADVTLLVDQLELTKVKATELLKQHDGDAVRAMTAYVTAAV